MKSVEQLGYRVTVGDVATQAGLEVNLAQQNLLALASDAGGHLQVADTGEIVYLFPQNFRAILRNKFWKLRFKDWWEKVWNVLFYLIRISFGIILVLSILIMLVAIIILVVAMNSSRDSNNGGGNRRSYDGSNISFIPYFWFSDLFYVFDPGYNSNYYQRQKQINKKTSNSENKMNFLEAIFSFLFGDGNPNIDLEERRWQKIGAVIRNHQGAIAAEQIAPYLDEIEPISQENEDYILPVLTRFNGYPEVSSEGKIIYYFPELQVTAKRQLNQSVSSYLQEKLWKFSEAGSSQIMGAIGLGAVNLILALILGSLLKSEVAATLGGLVGFVSSIYGILLVYAIGFLTIPLIRYWWIQGRNDKIKQRNQQRQARTEYLSIGGSELQHKLDYARQFAEEKVITEKDITYTTEKDILAQEIEQSDKIDEEWRRRLEQS
jgi:hypothetical protein